MSTKIQFAAGMLDPSTANIPTFSIEAGTNYPIACWRFADSATNDVYAIFRATDYASGNLTLDLDWYSIGGATTGDVKWQAAIAVTAASASFDFTAHAFATALTTTTTVLGTTGKRLNRSTITISNLDSLAADSDVVIKISRLGADGADTLVGDAALVVATVSYT